MSGDAPLIGFLPTFDTLLTVWAVGSSYVLFVCREENFQKSARLAKDGLVLLHISAFFIIAIGTRSKLSMQTPRSVKEINFNPAFRKTFASLSALSFIVSSNLTTAALANDQSGRGAAWQQFKLDNPTLHGPSLHL